MSRIKECFRSRWHAGFLINIDYSQLEVVALAVASGDAQLKADLKAGLDMHAEFCRELFGKVTPELRTWTKQMTFMLQYGASEYGMAKKLGIPKQKCKEFIRNYFYRYPDVEGYHNYLMKAVELNAYKDEEASRLASFPLMSSIYLSETGRSYKFTQSVKMKPDFRTKLTRLQAVWPVTQIKNYPVQGLATGDLVPLMCGILTRYLISESQDDGYDIIPINTVHDSIMLDSPRDPLAESRVLEQLKACKTILESAPNYMEKVYGIDWDMPTPVDIEYGKTWADMTRLKFT